MTVAAPHEPAFDRAPIDAFSLATASTFTTGIITALLAALIVFVLMPRDKIGEGPGAEA